MRVLKLRSAFGTNDFFKGWEQTFLFCSVTPKIPLTGW